MTPVYLRCREGSVSWMYPRGALRLLFRPTMPVDEKDFRVCIRVIRRPDPPDLFQTLRLNDTGKSICYIYGYSKSDTFMHDFIIMVINRFQKSQSAFQLGCLWRGRAGWYRCTRPTTATLGSCAASGAAAAAPRSTSRRSPNKGPRDALRLSNMKPNRC